MHLLVEKYDTDLVVGATLNDKRMKTIGDVDLDNCLRCCCNRGRIISL